MENDQNTLKEKSILPVILIIGQILFIIIIVSIISLFVRDEEISSVDYGRQPKVTIEDLASVLPDPSKTYIDVLESKLAQVISLNSGNYSTSDSEAIIRDGTFKLVNLDKDNVVFYSAIVDIPNLQQSYQIYDHYSGDKEPANRMYILCLDDDSEVIYPDFDCRDDYPSDIRVNIASGYIGYFNFRDFHAYPDEKDHSVIRIVPHTLTPSDSDKTDYINRAKEAIDSLGVPSSLFKYEVTDPRHLG